MPLIAFILVITALAGGYVAFFRNDTTITPEPAAPAVVETIPATSTIVETTTSDSDAGEPTSNTPTVVADPAPATPAPNTPAPVTTRTPTPDIPSPVPAATKTVTSQTVAYRTPAGNDNQIALTVTLNGTTVSDVSVNYNNGAGVHNSYQKRFDGAYRSQVIGKSISDVSLARVGGASLTSKAFNDALASVPR